MEPNFKLISFELFGTTYIADQTCVIISINPFPKLDIEYIELTCHCYEISMDNYNTFFKDNYALDELRAIYVYNRNIDPQLKVNTLKVLIHPSHLVINQNDGLGHRDILLSRDESILDFINNKIYDEVNFVTVFELNYDSDL